MSNEIKILFVENNANDIRLIQDELKKGRISFVSELAENESDYTISLREFEPDIILSAYSLPFINGITAYRIKERTTPSTPFIFVSENFGEEISIELIKNGVTDCALKDQLFALPTKVKRALRESREKRQRKSSEEDRLQSEGRLAKAQVMAHMGSWEFNLLTGTVTLSDEGCRILGIVADENEILFETFTSFIHQEDKERVLQIIKESEDSMKNVSYNYRTVQYDQSVRYIHSESKVRVDANGQSQCLYSIIHDVTDKHMAEDKIEFDRNNLNALINNTNDLMWSVDTDFKLMTSNQPFDDMVCLKTGELSANAKADFSDGFSQEELIQYKKSYTRALAGEKFTEIRYSHVPVELWSEVSFYPIRKGNKVIGTACHSRDITERKKAELKLELQNIELAFQNKEKGKRAVELNIANKELKFQNHEKEKRAAELVIANRELVFQNDEKGKRAAELILANKELVFQNTEKERRAAELTIANRNLEKAESYQREYIKGLEEMMYMTSHKVRHAVVTILGISNQLDDSKDFPEQLGRLVGYLNQSAMSLDNFTKELTICISALEHKGKSVIPA